MWFIRKSAPPNILLILVDDISYGDLKSYNSESKIPTPHIDGLVKEGMPFPRIKGQAYEHSAHMPMAIMWPEGIENGIIPKAKGTERSRDVRTVLSPGN